MASSFHFFYVLLLPLLSLAGSALSGSIVRELPGFPGLLPFTLETGYITVGSVEFFYYFVHSESNPAADPLLLYMNGGPGCSGLNAFFYQLGPLKFNVTDYVGGLPTLIYEPNGWSKAANLLFIDGPVGAGYSYATTQEGYYTTDTHNSQQMHLFLRKWLADHPKFQWNHVYIGSDSYAGMYTPMVVTDILIGNDAKLKPYINLEGYILSCPHTFTDLETNSKIPFVHRLTLISDAMYEAVKTSCGGNYVDSTNVNCTVDLAVIDKCLELISIQNVLEPYCPFLTPETNKAFRSLISSEQEKHRRALQEFSKDYLVSLPKPRNLWCKNFDYLLMDFWMNYPSVKAALHVRSGTVGQVYRCNASLPGYTVDINNVVPYHVNLTSKAMQVLVFSGDHDLVIPHNGIEEWIRYLNLTIDIDWRPWFVDGQVAGYTRKYTDVGYRLTYATLKGSGHSPPEYKRKECYNMFNRWVQFYPL